MEAPDERRSNSKGGGGGGWIGIDLGTSNCAAAAWDMSRSRPKVLRLGRNDLARPPVAATGGGGGDSKKGGKIVPSAVFFRDGGAAGGDRCIVPGMSSSVGHAAIQSSGGGDDEGGSGSSVEGGRSSGALVTSFKRVVGMTSREAGELKSSDPDFWNSLPFRAEIVGGDPVDGEEGKSEQQPQNDTWNHLDDDLSNVLGNASSDPADTHPSNRQPQDRLKEGVAISVRTSNGAHPTRPSERLVTPLQVTTILLRSIRAAASEYLSNDNKSKIRAPGMQEGSDVLNCVVGVPAHYGHAQRAAVRAAARDAGFAGHVGVVTESTAAAMAYGLFVSPSVSPTSTDSTSNDGDAGGGKNVLVFDMGGGTTDVTVVNLNFDEGADGGVRFDVVATAGDRRLGGDDVDELLARHIWVGDWKASEHREFVTQCRRAKEELCGDGGDDGSSDATGVVETTVALRGETINITRRELDAAIQALIDRAEHVIDDALSALESRRNSRLIHEVVLVGGSTRIPAIRSMLRRKFPPPVPPELCTSISAETAVAQGLAIRAALASGAVPLWELRNAMMLDVLPHSIGVWVGGADGNGKDAGDGAPFAKGQIITQPDREGRHGGHFVPILSKDAPLPAMGSANFTLAAADQSGITVVAAERIGPGDVYQCMGVFDFLLCRLDEDDDGGARRVEIGMTLKTSGEFVVSVFDERDPEHREKRRRYLKEKGSLDGNNDADVPNREMEDYYEEEEGRPACSGTEVGLLIFCVVLFAVYVAARVAFSDVEFPLENDEL